MIKKHIIEKFINSILKLISSFIPNNLIIKFIKKNIEFDIKLSIQLTTLSKIINDFAIPKKFPFTLKYINDLPNKPIQ